MRTPLRSPLHSPLGSSGRCSPLFPASTHQGFQSEGSDSEDPDHVLGSDEEEQPHSPCHSPAPPGSPGPKWARAMLELESSQRLDKSTGYTRYGMRDLEHTPDVRSPTAASKIARPRAMRPPLPQATSKSGSSWGRRGELLKPLSNAAKPPRTAPSRII